MRSTKSCWAASTRCWAPDPAIEDHLRVVRPTCSRCRRRSVYEPVTWKWRRARDRRLRPRRRWPLVAQAVVEPIRQSAVGLLGHPPRRPGLDVVHLAAGGRLVARGVVAEAVPHLYQPAQGPGEGALAAHVDDPAGVAGEQFTAMARAVYAISSALSLSPARMRDPPSRRPRRNARPAAAAGRRRP